MTLNAPAADPAKNYYDKIGKKLISEHAGPIFM